MQSTPFGNLSALNGMTVGQFLDAANTHLGGGPMLHSDDQTWSVTEQLTLAFEVGQPTQFAQDHLMVVPEPATAALALLGLLGLVRHARGRHRR